jgi:hypothetical protein
MAFFRVNLFREAVNRDWIGGLVCPGKLVPKESGNTFLPPAPNTYCEPVSAWK